MLFIKEFNYVIDDYMTKIRRWFAEDLVEDIPESFLAYPELYTFRGELKRLLKKYLFP